MLEAELFASVELGSDSPLFSLFISYWFLICCKQLVSCAWKALVGKQPHEVKCERIWLWFAQGEGEDKDSLETGGWIPSFCLRSCRWCVCFAVSLLCPSTERLSLRSLRQERQSGLFCPSIFQCRVTFSHYLPNAFSFHRADLRLEGHSAAAGQWGSRRSRLWSWFVDKWGKIDPRKMGEDNGRVRGKIDHLDLEQQWDRSSPDGAVMAFSLSAVPTLKIIRAGISWDWVHEASLGRQTLQLLLIR